MNIKHVKAGVIWTKLALCSYGVSLGMGLYGNSRTKFSSDFTYNVTLSFNPIIEISLWSPGESAFRYRLVAECQGPKFLADWVALLRSYRTKLSTFLL